MNGRYIGIGLKKPYRSISSFGDGHFRDKSVIRRNTFDGSTFCVLFQKILC